MEKNLYELMIQQSPVASIVFEIIKSGEAVPSAVAIFDANPAFERLSGVSRDKIVRKLISEIDLEICNRWFDWIVNDIKNTFASQTAGYERYVKDTGSWYRIYTYPLDQYYFGVSFLDITSEKQGEISNRLIFENASESILIVESGLVRFCNPMVQKMFQYSEEEMLNKPFLDLFHLDNRTQAEETYHLRLSGQKIGNKAQYKSVRSDGKFVWLEANGICVDWKGNPAILYFIVDITEQKKATEALKASEEQYRLIMEFSMDMIWVFNYTKQKPTYVSPSVFSMLGYLPEEFLTLNFQKLIPAEILADAEERLQKKVKRFLEGNEKSEPHLIEIQTICKNGERTWVELSARCRYNAKNEIEIIGISRNIEERKRAEQEILHLSYHDQLTGLYNRRFYEEELKRLDTQRNLPITLVMADVNGLKLTNDAFGHLEGDKLLICAANILKKACRGDDIIARIGGDEFIFLLPKTEQETAEKMIVRIKKTMLAENYENGILSVSFGSATKSSPAQDIYNVFSEAENAMYQRKLQESSTMRSKTIQVIAHSLFSSNKEEEAHNHRVGELCREIARAMDLDQETTNDIATAGFFHDIGKIGVNQKILLKTTPLTDDEWVELKRHPEKGYQILKSSAEFAQAAQYVLCHHERIDGQGYPQGLSGEDIPLPAKILTVADAYDSMTNPRQYHKKLDQKEVIEELKRNAGTQFDVFVTRVFIEKVLHQI